MDKSWISKARNSIDYSIGLSKFLDFAFKNGAVGEMIRCPCPKCGFMKWQTRDIVEDHLLYKPFPQNYVIWDLHGEKQALESSQVEDVFQDSGVQPQNPMEMMINDAFEQYRQHDPNVGASQPLNEDEIVNDEPREDHNGFYELLNDGSQTLYEGSKYTKLEFIIKLYHIKVLCGLSDKAMTMILDLLNDAFEKAKFPPSIYEAKKIINKLGLNYKKIDACPKHCMLYLGDDEKSLDACKHCGTSRWKPNKKKKIAAKVLRYFPLKPRLQRLFTCRKTAKDMRWHVLEDNKDGLLRHPRDGEAWKTFDLIHPEFSSDPRNVRLGLATDGFNPARTLSSTYSIWPIFLIPYNLPPWICMNHTSFILSMIIPGKQSPGNNIDVYLKPLVEELRELWSGVDTYDSSLNENFRIRAALMWTISDFAGLGILSGWNIHTGLACPTCNLDVEPCLLRNCNKVVFYGASSFSK